MSASPIDVYTAKAKRLSAFLAAKGLKLAHSNALHAIAFVEGFEDWHKLLAKIQAEEKPAGRTAAASAPVVSQKTASNSTGEAAGLNQQSENVAHSPLSEGSRITPIPTLPHQWWGGTAIIGAIGTGKFEWGIKPLVLEFASANKIDAGWIEEPKGEDLARTLSVFVDKKRWRSFGTDPKHREVLLWPVDVSSSFLAHLAQAWIDAEITLGDELSYAKRVTEVLHSQLIVYHDLLRRTKAQQCSIDVFRLLADEKHDAFRPNHDDTSEVAAAKKRILDEEPASAAVGHAIRERLFTSLWFELTAIPNLRIVNTPAPMWEDGLIVTTSGFEVNSPALRSIWETHWSSYLGTRQRARPNIGFAFRFSLGGGLSRSACQDMQLSRQTNSWHLYEFQNLLGLDVAARKAFNHLVLFRGPSKETNEWLASVCNHHPQAKAKLTADTLALLVVGEGFAIDFRRDNKPLVHFVKEDFSRPYRAGDTIFRGTVHRHCCYLAREAVRVLDMNKEEPLPMLADWSVMSPDERIAKLLGKEDHDILVSSGYRLILPSDMVPLNVDLFDPMGEPVPYFDESAAG